MIDKWGGGWYYNITKNTGHHKEGKYMTMEQSILKTAALYNKVIGYKEATRAFNRLIGKIDMYNDVMGRIVIYDINKDGLITSFTFGEDVMEV